MNLNSDRQLDGGIVVVISAMYLNRIVKYVQECSNRMNLIFKDFHHPNPSFLQEDLRKLSVTHILIFGKKSMQEVAKS